MSERHRGTEAPAHIKIGTLAKRTGLSVRTLHHYDDIGLLRPSSRTSSGHRLYGPADVARLQQVASLRQLGLSLDEIRQCLDGGVLTPLEIIERHLAFLEDHIRTQEGLRDRLRRIASAMRESESAPVTELVHAIEETTRFEKYYSKGQRKRLREQARQVGQARMEEVREDWANVFDAFEAARKDGTPPAHASVMEIARRARRLVGEFAGGDPDILNSLQAAYAENRGVFHEAWGIDEDLAAYYWEAMAALQEREA